MKKFTLGRTILLSNLLGIILLVLNVGGAAAQTSTFTYQGKLIDASVAANGQYDFTFKLYDLVAFGTQIGTDVVVEDVAVTAGIFTTSLDFGALPFVLDSARYLEISVRPGVSVGAFTILTPRQPLTSSPYSLRTLRAQGARSEELV